MMLNLDPIRSRLKAATPGPWEVEPSETVDGSFIANMGPIMIVPYFQGSAPMMADAELIAHAPTDLAALVAEVERLRSESTAGPDQLALVRRHLQEAHTRIGQLESDMERSVKMIGERAQKVARVELALESSEGEVERLSMKLNKAERELAITNTERLRYKREVAMLLYAIRNHTSDSPGCMDDDEFWNIIEAERDCEVADKKARRQVSGVPTSTGEALSQVPAAGEALRIPFE